MIAKMEKVTLIVLESRKHKALKELKNLGVVHLESLTGSGGTFEQIKIKQEHLEKALLFLPDPKKTNSSSDVENEKISLEPQELVEEILTIKEKSRSLQEELEKLIKERDFLLPWGNFDPQEIRNLEKQGLSCHLYILPSEKLKDFKELPRFFILQKTKTLIYGINIVLNKDSEVSIGHPEIPIPERGLRTVEGLMEDKRKELENLEKELLKMAAQRALLEDHLIKVKQELEFEEVRSGMPSQDGLAYLTGYIPSKRRDFFKETSKKNGWAILLQEPLPEDQVPTLVENPQAIRIIQPVFSLLGTVPGYRENDISFFFLIFFTIFFSMIIGDAGYGVILFIFSILGLAKSGKGKKPDGIILIMVLSFFTILWGSITGTWFGSITLAESPVFSWMVIPALSSFNPKSSEVIKRICFILGTVHLSIAHIWNFLKEVRKSPLIKSFAQLGWLSMVLGLFYLVLYLVLDPEKYPLPSYALYMILGGVIFVLIFSNQEGNFFKGILKGLGGILPTFLNSIGAFSDIISYIRLFAVGLASVEIAKSFNSMASNLGEGAVGIIAGALIMILGHSLNLAMGALSVVVHGVRLNMLEFSNHLGMEWSGIPYKPFKEIQ